MNRLLTVLAACATVLVSTPTTIAHFRLLAPASWIEENNLGDPQKLGPCGGTSADPGKPTGAVTAVMGGTMLKLRVQETVFHPGFYRVALAVNSRAELPPDPEAITTTTGRGPRSIAGKIQYPAQPPVLADGLFQHTARLNGELEADIPIPNINCANCILQVVQFMADHGLNRDGDYTYHHCAVLKIEADKAKPIDARFPIETGK
jgi:hypothetical protein